MVITVFILGGLMKLNKKRFWSYLIITVVLTLTFTSVKAIFAQSNVAFGEPEAVLENFGNTSFDGDKNHLNDSSILNAGNELVPENELFNNSGPQDGGEGAGENNDDNGGSQNDSPGEDGKDENSDAEDGQPDDGDEDKGEEDSEGLENEDPEAPDLKGDLTLEQLGGPILFGPMDAPEPKNGDNGEDVSGLLTNIEMKVTQNGTEIGENGTIDGTENIIIRVSFEVPVEGDGGDGPFVRKGDYAEFRISKAFKILGDEPIDLMFGDIKVGTVTFEERIENDGVFTYAIVDFDGEDFVFSPDEEGQSISDVIACFTAELQYKGHSGEDEWGTEEVTILDKSCKVEINTDEVAYTVEKQAAEILISDKKIRWEVTVDAEKTVEVAGNTLTKKIDLGGYTFKDDLASVGEYIADSFKIKIGDNTLDLTPQYVDGVLSYTFEGGVDEGEVKGPVTITFETEIPDDKYFADGEQSISNKAELYKEDSFIKEGSATARFTPPKWISKSGEVSGEYVNGNYDPSNRIITWTIEFNSDADTLKGVKITDILPAGLEWESAKVERYDDDDEEWKFVKDWDLQPDGGVYDIGNIDYKGRLIIKTRVTDTGQTTDITIYNNTANIIWDGLPGEDGISSEAGVGVGYASLTKNGEKVNPHTDRKIKWTVTFDPKGQKIDGLKIYDLLVYGDSFNKGDVTGIPTGIDLIPRFGQKYVEDSFEPTSPLENASLKVIPIKQGEVIVADLLVVTIPDTPEEQDPVANKFTFTSQIVHPKYFASNTNTQIYNTASLYQGTENLANADADVIYGSNVLKKELLKREEVAKIAADINANNKTSNASEGFNYEKKAAIFRLNINADGFVWESIDKGIEDELWGDVTITDSLPAGWEFENFDNGKPYLIYNTDASGLNADGAPLEGIENMSVDFGNINNRETVTFKFSKLNKPYIILIKAKPSDDTLKTYLTQNTRPVTVTNTAGLKVDGWDGISSSQNVRVNLQALKKEANLLQPDKVVKWTIHYNPYDWVIGNVLEDTLPEGVDLRVASNGKLILEGNIEVHEFTINADGSFEYSDVPVELKQDGEDRNIWYISESRTLHFKIPDPQKAYRFSYLTDVTTLSSGNISNSVKLLGYEEGSVENKAEFAVQEDYGRATMNRSGWLEINKKDSDGQNLQGATFRLYALDSDTLIREAVTSSNGVLRMMAIPEGIYRLIETEAPTGYKTDNTEYTVKVEKLENGSIKTTVNGKTGANAHILNVINYREDEKVGQLKIQKTVAGTDADTSKPFNFIITLGGTGEYTYVGNGVPGGIIENGVLNIALAHNQSITIIGLPEGTSYEVKEENYLNEGYNTVSIGLTRGEIVDGMLRTIVFTNTKNKPGDLTISKTVTGSDIDINKKFEFTVTLDTPVAPPSAGYLYLGNGAPNGHIKSGDKIYLAHGQNITIKDLPEGTKYKVEEANYLDEGYITESAGATGATSSAVGRAAAFTNQAPGSLIIRKIVEGNAGDRSERFTFVVTFSASDKFNYHGSKNGTISNGGRLTLAHNEYIVISGLPMGTVYKVIEEDANRNGYNTTSSGTQGIISTYEVVAKFVNTKNTYSSDVMGDASWLAVSGEGEFPKTGDNNIYNVAAISLAAFSLLLTIFAITAFCLNRKNKKQA